jgi:hypothetical protein
LRRIPRGTRILVEKALFTIQPPEFIPGRGYSLQSLISNIETSYDVLSTQDKDLYLSCHEHRSEADDSSSSREVLIFRSNAYTLPDGSIGIFPRIAKINHSCAPNAANVFSSPSGERIVFAGRDIAPGDEITVTYAPLLQEASARRARLAQYGFRCACEACVDAARTDGVRLEMATLLAELERLVASEDVTPGVLEKAERLADLTEQEELMDYLAKAHRLVAYFALRLGDRPKARRWALKELEVHRFADPKSQYAELAVAFLENMDR